MGDLDEAEFGRWRTQAAETLATARRVSGDSPAWSCFLAEQAAQFAVKGLLHGIGQPAWGHDLDALAADAERSSPELTTARSAARRLARFYIPTRYPDAQPGGVPSQRYGTEDAEGAVADAEAVLAAVDDAWGSGATRRGPMRASVIEQRRRERRQRIDRAEGYASALAERVPSLRAVVVFGSVARGDWNKWSDIDVLVVADDLPADALARLDLVLIPGFAGVQPVAWTPRELAVRRPTDPIATEVRSVGVVVHGSLPKRTGHG